VRRIVIAVAATVSGLVLLFSYYTSTDPNAAASGNQSAIADINGGSGPSGPTASSGDASGSGGTGSGGDGDNNGSGNSGNSSPSTSSGNSSSGNSGTHTYNGSAADTDYGPVQVQITVSNGKITAAKVLQVPTESSHDQRINAYAVPILNQEVVQAQSAQVDSVSGATYTSEGYIQSLQSAIDAAHLG
jgi:uncharacterized protein with FMN-binding domain